MQIRTKIADEQRDKGPPLMAVRQNLETHPWCPPEQHAEVLTTEAEEEVRRGRGLPHRMAVEVVGALVLRLQRLWQARACVRLLEWLKAHRING